MVVKVLYDWHLVVVGMALFVVHWDALLDVFDHRHRFVVLPAFLAFRLFGLPGHRHCDVVTNL
jgi:hypothetical protein